MEENSSLIHLNTGDYLDTGLYLHTDFYLLSPGDFSGELYIAEVGRREEGVLGH